MFGKFLEFWKVANLVDRAREETREMLSIASSMFDYAISSLIGESKDAQGIYDMDQKLNKMQIDVRKKILEHFAINPKTDITPSLVLINIVVDIERIGDYAKNMMELVTQYPNAQTGGKFEKIREIERIVKENFEKVTEIFSIDDEEKSKILGKEVMDSHLTIANMCEEIVNENISNPVENTRDVILCVLLARFLKRVSAHLKNVASSAVNPFPYLGYKPQEDSKES